MERYKEIVTFYEHPTHGKGKRRASLEVRRSNIFNHAAVAIRLNLPPDFVVMPGTWPTTLDGTENPIPELKNRTEVTDAFDKMQRKLYRVTSEGCIIPHYSWGTRAGGNVDKGYQLMMDAYYGWRPAGGGLGVPETVNRLGWSEVIQASHICHMGPMCCNPCHVIGESRWRNFKRNYCGCDGFCDCSEGLSAPLNQFPCVNVYRNRDYSTIAQDDTEFLTDPEQIREKLDIVYLPGFFHPRPNSVDLDVINRDWTNRFIEGVHWDFIPDDEIAKWAEKDAQAGAKLNVKRTKRPLPTS